MWEILYWRGVEILICTYTTFDFLPKFWQRVKQHASKSLEELQRRNEQQNKENGNLHQTGKRDLQLVRDTWEEYTKVLRAAEIEDIEINTAHVPVCKGKLNSLSTSQMPGRQKGESISLLLRDKEAREYHQSWKEPIKVSNNNNYYRRKTIVTEIAKRFEENDFSANKMNTTSLSENFQDVYFEGATKISKEITTTNNHLQKFCSKKDSSLSSSTSNFPHSALNGKYEGVVVISAEPLEQKNHNTSFNYTESIVTCCNTSQASNSLSDRFENNTSDHHNGGESHNRLGRDECNPEQDKVSCTNNKQTNVSYRRNRHLPVETIEDILAQQRFSRSLSTYSISDLLNDCPTDVDVDEYINNITK